MSVGKKVIKNEELVEISHQEKNNGIMKIFLQVVFYSSCLQSDHLVDGLPLVAIRMQRQLDFGFSALIYDTFAGKSILMHFHIAIFK